MSFRKKTVTVIVSFSLIMLTVSANLSANQDYVEITYKDTATGFNLSHSFTQEGTDLPWRTAITLEVTPTVRTDKMRLTVQDNRHNCDLETETDSQAPFRFTIRPKTPDTRCAFLLEGWLHPWNWRGDKKLSLTFTGGESDTEVTAPDVRDDDVFVPVDIQNQSAVTPATVSQPAQEPREQQRAVPTDKVSAPSDMGAPLVTDEETTADISPIRSVGADNTLKYAITQGSPSPNVMPLGSLADGGRPNHGVRIYCPISHFSHDDPIIFPNKPGAAHLHMFISNTEADAYSTPESLLNSGNSTCNGGINVRSSYWTPAVFSEKDEAVIPESAFIYYKTFGVPDDNFDKLQIIPNGMQMLATKTTLNAGDSSFRVERHEGERELVLTVYFPSCFATENGEWNGKPILSYRDMPGDKAKIVNSHVAYSEGLNANFMGCPQSHPYRTATMSIHLHYDLDIVGDKWYLSSDADSTTQGETLHADYIAAWAYETMEMITRCNREARSCDFDAELPERYLSPDGKQVYTYSIFLHPDTDRTPFGTTVEAYK